ncbi:tail completion protein gp17 [Sphingomonas sanxanigenens]|uniref:DUF3168 domain-containing protein n=1 Tax=Sphingomonas sanxanigenens DSM 19645 = NX02 TaxID=1123269 RepID=W0A6E9_9SPHN|nr:DUF3168 domain-containing protein [Sphingomonas sanxanigenens]AHE52636.1 hypothetical protein NX02_04460 [Sphingomonas sanxanigenens DSM 19645 = NX02]
MEEALRDRLLANPGLSALVGDRIWWVERPQSSALPALTLQLISPGRTYTHDGPAGFYGPRVQCDSWGGSYGSARLVSRALLAAIEPATTVGGVEFKAAFLDSERDMPVSEMPDRTTIFRVSQDFFVWWKLPA